MTYMQNTDLIFQRTLRSCYPLKQELQLDIERLEGSLREKTRENRRLQENFNTLKSGNDVLRKEVSYHFCLFMQCL